VTGVQTCALPIWQILRAIQAETAHAEAGRAGRIIAKMNALVEPEVIGALYAASRAGVQIDLIVRGVCALRPGVAGASENIRVRSIIGRFLEHSSAFHFHNDGAQNLYLSSADWMGRNFFGRVEICFPILAPELKRRVVNEGLKPYLEANAQAWVMNPNGEYQPATAKDDRTPGAQQKLLSVLAPANAA